MRAADDEDFTAFVAAVSRRMLRSAYLITGNAEEAQDLLQIALERTYRHWPRVRRQDSPEAYARKILVNAATDQWRRNRDRNVSLADQRLQACEDPGLAGLPGREALLRRIRELPVGQRAVLVLRYFDDLTELETAHVLGCSVGTVKSQHARALARLRQQLPDRRSL
jgi:RNA polymerase sigma-70 factor (sigma-E family)